MSDEASRPQSGDGSTRRATIKAIAGAISTAGIGSLAGCSAGSDNTTTRTTTTTTTTVVYDERTATSETPPPTTPTRTATKTATATSTPTETPPTTTTTTTTPPPTTTTRPEPKTGKEIYAATIPDSFEDFPDPGLVDEEYGTECSVESTDGVGFSPSFGRYNGRLE